MKCLICSKTKTTLVAPMVRWCPDCNSFFREKDVDYKVYYENGYHFDPDWLRLQQENQARYFERDISLSDDVIEFGSCWGDVVAWLSERLCKGTASDVKKLLRKEYKNYITELSGTFENVTSKNIGQFNVVIMNNTIEHINDPHNTFKKVSKILNKKGRFLFITEDADNHLFGLLNMTLHAEHRFIIGRKATELLAKKYGFKIIRYDNLFFNNAIYVALEKI